MDIALTSSPAISPLAGLSPRERSQREDANPFLKGPDFKQKTGLPPKPSNATGQNDRTPDADAPPLPKEEQLDEVLRVKAFFSDHSEKPKILEDPSKAKNSQDSKDPEAEKLLEDEAKRRAAVKEVLEKLAGRPTSDESTEEQPVENGKVLAGADGALEKKSEETFQKTGSLTDRLNGRTKETGLDRQEKSQDSRSDEARKKDGKTDDREEREAAVQEALEKEEARRKAFAELQQKLTEILNRQEASEFIGKHANVHA